MYGTVGAMGQQAQSSTLKFVCPVVVASGKVRLPATSPPQHPRLAAASSVTPSTQGSNFISIQNPTSPRTSAVVCILSVFPLYAVR